MEDVFARMSKKLFMNCMIGIENLVDKEKDRVIIKTYLKTH